MFLYVCLLQINRPMDISTPQSQRLWRGIGIEMVALKGGLTNDNAVWINHIYYETLNTVFILLFYVCK